MLWFGADSVRMAHQRFLFKNILCYGSAAVMTTNNSAIFYLKTSYVMVRPAAPQCGQRSLADLKTSYVMVRRHDGWESVGSSLIFKNILCYGSARVSF